MTHIDEWIDTPCSADDPEAYAKFFFLLKRTPAWMQYAFAKWINEYRLFCTYEGKRYKVTGASRLGDIWLAEDFMRDTGYDLRVDVAKCGGWSNKL